MAVVQGVQPEAVSFMQRAVRAVSNRLVVSAAAAHADGTLPEGNESRSIAMEDVQEAIRGGTPAPWMAPPCQRASGSLGFTKFNVA